MLGAGTKQALVLALAMSTKGNKRYTKGIEWPTSKTCTGTKPLLPNDVLDFDLLVWHR